MIKILHYFNKKYSHHYFCFLYILLLAPLLLANEIDRVATILKDINSHFLEMSSIKKISTMDLDAMDKQFRSIIRNNSAIENLMRINSNGIVINEIESQVINRKMRNVSEQKWFLHVKSTRKPYYGLSRDSLGGTFFFWSWPLVIDDTVFNGAISAKIRSSAILKMASINESTPVVVLFNGTPVFKRFSDQISNPQIDTISLSKKSEITIQTQSQDSTKNFSSKSKTKSMQSDLIEAENYDTNLNKTQLSVTVKENQSRSGTVALHSDTASPIVFKSSLLEKIPQKKFLLQSNTLIIIAICLACVIILVLSLFTPKKRKKPYYFSQENVIDSVPEKKEESTTSPAINKIPRIPELKSYTSAPEVKKNVVKENLYNSDNSPKEDFEEETREINAYDPKYHYLQQKQKNQTPESNSIKELEEKIRKDLYREIHSQIMQWVVCESARLSGRIEELNSRLEKSEIGNPKEIESIKNEAQQISKEIELFKTHLTDKDN